MSFGKFPLWPGRKKNMPEVLQQKRWEMGSAPPPKLGEQLTDDQIRSLAAMHESTYRETFGRPLYTSGSLNDFLGFNMIGPGEPESRERKEWEAFLNTIVGHGMTRHSLFQSTEILVRLLGKQESLKGDWGRLHGDIYMDAWNGPETKYLLVSRSGKPLVDEKGMLSPAAVLVNGLATAYLPALRERFPNITFINATLSQEEFAKQLRKACE